MIVVMINTMFCAWHSGAQISQNTLIEESDSYKVILQVGVNRHIKKRTVCNSVVDENEDWSVDFMKINCPSAEMVLKSPSTVYKTRLPIGCETKEGDI
jgi:hypothetical protein